MKKSHILFYFFSMRKSQSDADMWFQKSPKKTHGWMFNLILPYLWTLTNSQNEPELNKTKNRKCYFEFFKRKFYVKVKNNNLLGIPTIKIAKVLTKISFCLSLSVFRCSSYCLNSINKPILNHMPIAYLLLTELRFLRRISYCSDNEISL